MSFVHGHARDTGWVVAHRRAPHRAEDGQLALPVAVPEPRPAARGQCEERPREASRPGSVPASSS